MDELVLHERFAAAIYRLIMERPDEGPGSQSIPIGPLWAAMEALDTGLVAPEPPCEHSQDAPQQEQADSGSAWAAEAYG